MRREAANNRNEYEEKTEKKNNLNRDQNLNTQNSKEITKEIGFQGGRIAKRKLRCFEKKL